MVFVQAHIHCHVFFALGTIRRFGQTKESEAAVKMRSSSRTTTSLLQG